MVDSLQSSSQNTKSTKKAGRPKGFVVKEKKPAKKIRKISLVFSDTQFLYLEELAKRESITLTNFVTTLIEYHIDTQLLCGELEFNIPLDQKPNRELFLILKALVYGELKEDEKLTNDDIHYVAFKLGCDEEKIFTLLEKVE